MLAIACDHGGYELKLSIIKHLNDQGIQIDDLGCNGERSDYPVYAEKLCRAIVAGKYERGILLCGTGIGISIAANKIHGIRAALCSDCFSAEMSRFHNDANVLCMGGRVIGPELANKIVDTYLSTPFSGEERHIRRVGLVKELDK